MGRLSVEAETKTSLSRVTFVDEDYIMRKRERLGGKYNRRSIVFSNSNVTRCQDFMTRFHCSNYGKTVSNYYTKIL